MAVTQGTWGNFLGPLSNIDFGITEGLTRLGVLPYSPITYNPNQSIQSPGLDYSQMPTDLERNSRGQVLGTGAFIGPTYNGPQNPPASGNREGSQDSPLRALEKIGWDGMNPSQRSDYLRMLGQQQQDLYNSPEYKAEQLRKQQEEESAINGIYSPLFSSLDEQRRNIEAQQPGEEAKIQGAYDRGIEGVAGQQQEAQMQLAKRGTASNAAEANALANARQLYSELSQRYGSMFGSRSSAGPAAQELLGRETTRRFGEVGTQKEQDRQAIADETARLTTWTSTQKNEWERKKREALDTLSNTFKNTIAQINSQRGILESQKARDRATALQDARTKQATVEQADRDFQQRLALFQAEKQSQLTSTPQYGMNTWNSAIQGQYNGPQMGQATNQGATGTTVTRGVTQNKYGQLIDEYGRVIQQ